MPLTPDEASTIAARHGLSVADAHALAELCDDTDTAETVAAKFATSPERSIVRRIFESADSPRRVELGPDTDLRTAAAHLFKK